MLKVILPNELEENCTKLNHCIYLSSNDTVFKDCQKSRNCPAFVDMRLTAVDEFGPIDGVAYPFSLLCDNDYNIYGYEMDFLAGYKSIYEFIKSDECHLSLSDKKSALLNVYYGLRTLNKSGYIVGDINIENVMVSPFGQGRIIDWENGFLIGSGLYDLSKYEFYGITSEQSDALKMFINSISLLYGLDFETFFCSLNVHDMFEMIRILKLDPIIIDYINDFEHEINTNSGHTLYFDDYINEFREVSSSKLEKIRRRYDIYGRNII